MAHMKKTLFMLACVAMLVGCRSTVVTPEGTEAQYRRAERTLIAVLSGAMPEVVEATTATLKDLELVGVESTVDKLKGNITARMAVGTKVTIHLEAVDFTHTTVKIRVGTFGDKSVSLQILRNIEKRLKK